MGPGPGKQMIQDIAMSRMDPIKYPDGGHRVFKRKNIINIPYLHTIPLE